MIVRELVFKLGFSSKDAQRAADRFDRTVDGLKDKMVGLGKAAIVAAGAMAYAAFRMSDSYLLLQSRLSTVIKEQEKLNQVSEELFQIAQRQRQPIEAVTDLYIKMAQATENLGFSQEKTAKVTEAFAASLILSGARGPAAEAAILQFSQGVSSGKLSGDEYKTLRETNAQYLQALMAGSGKTRAELDKMAEGGQLTPEFLFKATLNQYDDLVKRAAQVRRSVPQAGVQVLNSLQKRIGEIASKSDAFDKVVAVFDKLRVIIESPRFGRAIEGIIRLFSVLLDMLVGAIDVMLRLIDIIERFIQALGGLEKAVRILGSVILALLIRRLWILGTIWVSYIAYVGVAAFATNALAIAVGFLSKAFLFLVRAFPLLLIISILALVIEDLWAFVQGNDSIIGRLIAAWDDYVWYFKELWNGVSEWFSGIFDSIVEKAKEIGGWALKIAKYLPGGGALAAGAMIGDQIARSGSNNTNISMANDVTVNVPVGTSQEQAIAIQKQVRDAFADQMLSTYRNTMNDFPVTE